MHKIKAENSFKKHFYILMFGMVDISVSWNEYQPHTIYAYKM